MNYKKIDTIDLGKIKKELSSIKFTRTYALQGTNKDEDPFKYIIPDNGLINAWERAPKGITAKDLTITLFDTPYINSLIDKFKIGYTRVCILDSKKCYSLHKDISKRIHIPIETNDKCFFVIDDKVVRLPADGSVYEVDTTKIHTFVNASINPRIHIVGTLLDYK